MNHSRRISSDLADPHFQKKISLKPFTTFGVEAIAEQFVEVATVGQLRWVLRLAGSLPVHILGGGSNILITHPEVHGLIVRIGIKGIVLEKKFSHHVWVSAGAGENWHDLVTWALHNNLGGIENLSLIPGTCGAAPIQNIGAYGIELQDVFLKLEAIHLRTGARRIFYRRDCAFGYRDSLFKKELKNQYCITRIWLKLQLPPHRIHLKYGDIKRELAKENILNPGIHDVSKAVIAIRSSKLPDPAKVGNAGSFFKNPVIKTSQWTQLKKDFPDMPAYQVDDSHVKVPAGWLIERLGWKGKIFGQTGSYSTQALVLVNYGNASGSEILHLAKEIMRSVKNTFEIDLQPEVNFW